MRIRNVGVLAGLLSFVSIVAACGSTGSSAGSGSSGSTLVVDSKFSFTSKDADPARGGVDFTAVPLFHAMYDTLLTFANNDYTKPVASLASSFTPSADDKTFTFKLRKDVTFSNGDPMTSADVVFSFLRLQNVKDTPSYLMAGVTSVTAPDTSTVVIKTASPDPALPFVLTNPAMAVTNAKQLQAHGGTDAQDGSKTDSATSWLGTASVGTGPYVLKSYSASAQVVLTANPHYWGPNKPHYKTVVYSAVDPDTQALNIRRGTNAVALDIPTTQASGMKSLHGLSVQLFSSPISLFLFMNSNPAISSTAANPDIQNAVRYGLDYTGLISLAGPGSARAAGIVPPGFLGALPQSDAIKTDLAKAKQYVQHSGIQNPTLQLHYQTGTSAIVQTLASRIQSGLAQVGITVTLTPQSAIVGLQDYRAGKDAMGLFNWAPDYPDPNDYLAFIPGGTVGLRAGWPASANPGLAAQAAAAASTTVDRDRGAKYVALQHELNLASPIYPLVFPGESIVSTSNLSGVQFSSVWYLDFSQIKNK
ncbi:MAG: extracellular solute-binding protein [Actinoallomurus sp.]|jgi:peptide/nickel transport system substrate-binding protein|nr:extracellular solute-binding protein [Actinoallomurus sp.]